MTTLSISIDIAPPATDDDLVEPHDRRVRHEPVLAATVWKDRA
ncbi:MULTISPECIES: hypothetical protein [Bacteria]